MIGHRRALLGAAALALACNTRSPDSAGGVVGVAAAKAVIAAMRAAEQVRAPWRCARLRPAPPAAGPAVTAPSGSAQTPTPTVIAHGERLSPPSAPNDVFDAGARRWQVDGDALRSDGGDGLRIGVVADGRGGGDAVRAALLRLGTQFKQANVDVVVAVGGMGQTEAELAAALQPLTTGPWPVIAIPGDRESWPALRRAVASLRSTGAAIVDGAAVRYIEAGGALVATLPGMPFRERLAAGDDGCSHDGDDVAALLEAIAARRGKATTALLTPRAPRTTGDGSDLATGGVHAGDVELTRALAAHPVDVVIHGQVADRALRAGRAARGPVVVPAGSVDPVPRFDEIGARIPAQAVVVTLERRGGISWLPIAVLPGT